MPTLNSRWALLLALAVVPAACGGDDQDERAALEQDELDRELDLALQGDTATLVFEDTAQGVEVTEEPTPVAPRPQPRTPPRPAPTPAPRREAPAPAPTPDPTPRRTTSTVASGTSLGLTLNEELSTETNQVGDGFTATLTQDIRGTDGEVVIPAGATVRGRVTQASKSGRVGETAVITVAFESVSFNGRSYPLEATVLQANPERRNRTSTQEQVGKAAAGAAAGAIIGRVLGKDTKSTLKGAVVGAAAGTAIAMGTADVDAVLPAGSQMVIRLDAPLEVRRAT